MAAPVPLYPIKKFRVTRVETIDVDATTAENAVEQANFFFMLAGPDTTDTQVEELRNG